MTPQYRNRRSRRTAFSLIEILVVIGVMGILMGLLLVGVQAAREASRRISCSNNLHQLGVALNAYASTYGVFPAGHGDHGISPHVAILPYMEQTTIFNSLNFTMNGMNIYPENRTAVSFQISSFVCPSDTPTSAGGRTNYAGNRGLGVQKYGYNGAFGFTECISPAGFPDGLSFTAAMSEWLTGEAEPEKERDRRRSVFRTLQPMLDRDEFDAFVSLCLSLDPKTAPLGAPPAKGSNWIFGEFGMTLYNHTLPINQNSCINGTAYQQGAWTAGSAHSGGASLVFADGHARFLRDTVTLEVWRAIGSRNGGEGVASGLE
jgi:prepilin-type N-terminal cleavage/methylation domain-containing protein/prepilin-type processing-associated H-X9-DG protein